MRPQALSSTAPRRTFVHTFSREDMITTPFRREPVDVDDTVPVALYSQPYERIELADDSRPYDLVELEMEIDVAAFDVAPDAAVPIAIYPRAETTMPVQVGTSKLQVVLTISLLVLALVVGFEIALLVL